MKKSRTKRSTKTKTRKPAGRKSAAKRAPAKRAGLPPPVAMRGLLTGYWISQCLYAAARLELADKIVSGPKSPADLAKETGAKAESIGRVLRALASVGVFRETKDGKFGRTALSDTLRTGTPQSMRSFALMIVRGYNWLPFANLTEGLSDDRLPFEAVHGMKVFDYLEAHPEEGKTFGESMTSVSGVENPAVADAYDFSRFKTLVDVGGSQGHLLAEILRKHKKVRGILFDQPSVIERARAAGYVTAPPVRDRIDLASGSFFEGVPAGADAYVMKYVLHDWDDDGCVKILSQCRAAMAKGGRVLVIDNVVLPGNEPAWGKLLDIAMLVLTGGKERTPKQFADLFARAGLKLRKIHATACDLSIVEGVAADAAVTRGVTAS